MKSEAKIFYAVLAACTIVLAYVVLAAEATFDKGDGIQHYLISRYSWKHPELLLNHWGKPFFTLISSSFSQFGIKGICFFNLACAVLSAWCSFKIANRFGIPLAWALPVLLFFSTIYFAVINSGLTEPLFGLVLVGSIYFFVEKKFFLSALLVSFLPFVRSEGFLLLPLFGIILLYRRKLLLAPVLAAGTLVYSVLGGIYYKDFLWIWNQNPYNPGTGAYGHGELFHFVKQYDMIWGTVLFGLFCLGIAFFIFKLGKNMLKKENAPNKFLAEELILVYGSFAVYFLAHSIFWWKGICGSLGLIRVIAAVMPLCAIISLRGLSSVANIFDLNKFLQVLTALLILFFVIKAPFQQWWYPFQLEGEERVTVETGKWFNESEYKNNTVYYLQPYLTIALNIDPFDKKKVTELWWLNEDIKNNAVPKTAIIFWDAHYGPVECHLPPETFNDTAKFKLLKTFEPVEKFKAFDKYYYEIRVYEAK